MFGKSCRPGPSGVLCPYGKFSSIPRLSAVHILTLLREVLPGHSSAWQYGVCGGDAGVSRPVIFETGSHVAETGLELTM